MAQRLDNRMRFRLLAFALAVSPLLLYWIAVSDTVEAAQSCERLQEQYEQVGEIESKLMEVRRQLTLSGASLGMVKGSEEFQTGLLAAVSGYCSEKGIELVDFPASEFYTEGGMTVETIAFTVEGAFIPTVRLIHHLETEAKVGKLSSTAYRRTITKKDKRTVLRTTIHIQHVKQAS